MMGERPIEMPGWRPRIALTDKPPLLLMTTTDQEWPARASGFQLLSALNEPLGDPVSRQKALPGSDQLGSARRPSASGFLSHCSTNGDRSIASGRAGRNKAAELANGRRKRAAHSLACENPIECHLLPRPKVETPRVGRSERSHMRADKEGCCMTMKTVSRESIWRRQWNGISLSTNGSAAARRMQFHTCV